MRFIVYFGH